MERTVRFLPMNVGAYLVITYQGGPGVGFYSYLVAVDRDVPMAINSYSLNTSDLTVERASQVKSMSV